MLIAALLGLCGHSLNAQPTAPQASFVRVIPQGGGPVDYDLAAATDQGSFEGPGFVQRSFALPRSPALPSLSVLYRPDSDGKRAEVVLEQSDATARQGGDLAAYRVILQVGGKTILSGETPKHFWGARWRLQSSPRPRIRTVEAATRAGLVPAYEAVAVPGRVVAPYTPMGLGSLFRYMPTTGERDDIGLFPAWVAEYFATGSDAGWKQTIANAEAASTLPWHWRDETGQVFNIDRHPDWSIDPRFAPPNKVAAQNRSPDKDTPTVDDAHQPELAYVAYLMTGDPYYLEELQFQANWHMWSHGSRGGLGLLSNSQVRGLAWTLREVAVAAAITPGRVPAWLLPRDYFLRKLENNRKWLFERTVDSIHPIATTFHFPWVPEPDKVASWQEDFNALVVGMIVHLGFEQWRPLQDWITVNLAARGDGKSGWPRSTPIWYYIQVANCEGPAANWSELARLNADALKSAGNDAGIAKLDLNYIGTYLGAVRLAIAAGHRELQPMLKWYQDRLPSPAAKFAFSPRPASATPQDASQGDPQFRSSKLVLPKQPGQFTRPEGIETVVGSAAGQVLVVQAPAEYVRPAPLGPGIVEFADTHGGVGTFLVKDVAVIKFGNRIWDTRNQSWSPTEAR
ncbi:MAG: hypothetical protein JO227_23895 [Acetobacteraceae bacterium]|nr:hypothetical protein [Acetobacteraceae bacterium]